MYDCALFDIDGVLVDIRKSYNAAIKKTATFMLEQLSGKVYRGLVTDQIILKFRQSGGFNNDTDTTYAIVLATLSNPPKSIAGARRFLTDVASNADETGILSVEKFLEKYGMEKWKRTLGYPGSVRECVLARVFDEFFYGPKLFRRQDHLEPDYWKGAPLIKNDVLVVSASTMRALHKKFGGRLGIVSGRSRIAAEYSLGRIMKYFHPRGCVFLEDESREHAKPSPYAIRKSMEGMGARSAVYAGDSAEDLLMARRAEAEMGVRIAFVGIYGYSPIPSKTLENLEKLGVKYAARTANQLPNIIRKKL